MAGLIQRRASPAPALPQLLPSPTVRAVGRALLFLAMTGVLLLLHVAIARLGESARAFLRRLWCRGCCRILGLEVTVTGRPASALPTLFVANHVSYLDIPVLGGVATPTFIAKAEVAGWPLFGLLGRLGSTLFIRRHWRDARNQCRRLADRLARGESFLLFAEGTSGDGLDILPFKTSLFAVAEPRWRRRPMLVQPVTLVYRALHDGTPITAANAELYAWIGEATLLAHLWNVLKRPGARIELAFGKPVAARKISSRKELAARLHSEMRETLRRPPAAPHRLLSDKSPTIA